MATKRPDGRVEPGQRISSAFSAKAWNRAQDAADVVLGARTGFEADGIRGPSAPYTYVYCKASVAVERWGVLEITGMEIAPTGATGAATSQFESMPVLTGGTPSEDSRAIAIAVEPIAANAIGRVAIDGAVQVKLDVGHSDHRFARPKASTSAMQSDWGGPAMIIWKPTGTGANQWSLVRMGGGSPTGIDVVTNATLGPTGIQFERKRVWAHGVTGITGTAIGTTGC
jgi:hypothetical protein